MMDLPKKTFLLLVVCLGVIGALEFYAISKGLDGVALSAAVGVIGVIAGHATKYWKRGKRQ